MQRWRTILLTTTWRRPSKHAGGACIGSTGIPPGNNINKTFLSEFVFSKIREELGMKLLSRDKFPSLSSPATRENKATLKKVSSYIWTVLPWTKNKRIQLKCEIFLILFISDNKWTRKLYLQTHTVDAVLLLLKDLDEEELHIVHTATQNRLQTYTLDQVLTDSRQTQKAVDVQHWSISLHALQTSPVTLQLQHACDVASPTALSVTPFPHVEESWTNSPAVLFFTLAAHLPALYK